MVPYTGLLYILLVCVSKEYGAIYWSTLYTSSMCQGGMWCHTLVYFIYQQHVSGRNILSYTCLLYILVAYVSKEYGAIYWSTLYTSSMCQGGIWCHILVYFIYQQYVSARNMVSYTCLLYILVVCVRMEYGAIYWSTLYTSSMCQQGIWYHILVYFIYQQHVSARNMVPYTCLLYILVVCVRKEYGAMYLSILYTSSMCQQGIWCHILV